MTSVTLSVKWQETNTTALRNMKTLLTILLLVFASVANAQFVTQINTDGGPMLAGDSRLVRGGQAPLLLNNILPDSTNKTNKVFIVSPTGYGWSILGTLGGGTGPWNSSDSLKILRSRGTLSPTWVTVASLGAISVPVSISNGGTGDSTQAGALKNLAPDSTGKSGDFLQVKAGGGFQWAAAKMAMMFANVTIKDTCWSGVINSGSYATVDKSDTAKHRNTETTQFTLGGTIKNLTLFANITDRGCDGDTVQITLYKMGTATTLVVTLVGNAFFATDSTHTVTVAAGDLISVRAYFGAGNGCVSSPDGFNIGFEFDPN